MHAQAEHATGCLRATLAVALVVYASVFTPLLLAVRQSPTQTMMRLPLVTAR
jgi:hypothetical protein